MGKGRLIFAQETCVKKAGLALQRTGALWPGCRIGIAVSGGVDSFTLLKTMKIRQAIVPFPFEIMALHCNPGFEPADHKALLSWLAREGIPGHIEICDFGPRAHSTENRRRSPCFFCARHRRKRLFALCAQYRLTHLAIGHNADDLLATFLLNFCRNGRVDGLAMNESFFNGALRIIRPLALVEKKYIRRAAREWKLPVWENSCPTSGATARDATRGIVEAITEKLPNAPRSMLNAITRWQLAKDTPTVNGNDSQDYQPETSPPGMTTC